MKYKNATQAFEMLYKEIMTYGEDFAGTKTVFNKSFSLSHPEDMVVTTGQRKFNKDYAEYEWQWYLSGNRDASEISERAKIWKNMMVPGTTEVNSNYGYFWNKNNQYSNMIEELKKNKESRRAIMVHYDPNELDRYKYDTPCNLVLNFYIFKDKLHLTVFARSIDLVFGFCNDQYTFAKLMQRVSEELNTPVGEMHWHVTNLHEYPRHYNLM